MEQMQYSTLLHHGCIWCTTNKLCQNSVHLLSSLVYVYVADGWERIGFVQGLTMDEVHGQRKPVPLQQNLLSCIVSTDCGCHVFVSLIRGLEQAANCWSCSFL